MRWLTAFVSMVAAFLVAASVSTSAERAPVCSSYLNVPRESDPLASRDGRLLVWTQTTWRGPAAAVYVSAPDGSVARKVSPSSLVVDSTAIAPDGSQVLITSHDRSATHWTLASTSARDHRAVDEAEAREIRRRWRTPEWSPDGRLVLEARLDGLWVVSAERGDRHLFDRAAVWQAAWAPDGQQIAFQAAEGYTDGGSHLHVVNADGTGLRRVTENESVTGFSWSPDGRWIAFSDDRSSYHEGAAIAVVHPDGTGLRLVTRHLEGPDERSAGQVSWIGATRLVFASSERRQGRRKVASIHTIGLDGRAERRVTYHCHLGTPANDVLRGSILGDTLRSFAGADEVVPGPGSDDVDSGSGRDLVRARDGTRDIIRCGAGRDTVLADQRDAVRDCERVLRR